VSTGNPSDRVAMPGHCVRPLLNRR